jgi:hypothetical protein
MVETCDSHLYGKREVEERNARKGLFCFVCNKNMCKKCAFDEGFVCCNSFGVVCCVENSRLCHWDCNTCERTYCRGCFEGHAMRMCTACKQLAKYEDCATVLDECSHCGDKAFDHDDTAHNTELYCYEDLLDDDGKYVTIMLYYGGEDSTVADDDDNDSDDGGSVDAAQLKRETEASKKEHCRLNNFLNQSMVIFGL